jgi:hypothetical protein
VDAMFIIARQLVILLSFYSVFTLQPWLLLFHLHHHHLGKSQLTKIMGQILLIRRI